MHPRALSWAIFPVHKKEAARGRAREIISLIWKEIFHGKPRATVFDLTKL
jgi:hypothetical protein